LRFFLIKQSNNKIKPTYLSGSIFDSNFKLEVDIILVKIVLICIPYYGFNLKKETTTWLNLVNSRLPTL